MPAPQRRELTESVLERRGGLGCARRPKLKRHEALGRDALGDSGHRGSLAASARGEASHRWPLGAVPSKGHLKVGPPTASSRRKRGSSRSANSASFTAQAHARLFGLPRATPDGHRGLGWWASSLAALQRSRGSAQGPRRTAGLKAVQLRPPPEGPACGVLHVQGTGAALARTRARAGGCRSRGPKPGPIRGSPRRTSRDRGPRSAPPSAARSGGGCRTGRAARSRCRRSARSAPR